MNLQPHTARSLTLTLSLLTAGLTAGCGTTPTSTPTPSVSVSRQAGGITSGSYLDLANDTGETITITDLIPNHSDSVGLGEIPTGGTAFIEGGPDVQMEIAFPDAQSFRLTGEFVEGREPRVKTDGDPCGWITYPRINSAANWFYKDHGFTINRAPDKNDDMFRLQITFTNSKFPGSTDICVSGRYTIS